MSAKMTKMQRAGVTLPISRVNRNLRRAPSTKRVGAKASVYLAAALEYVTTEATELAGDLTKLRKRKRVDEKDLLDAVRADAALQSLLGGCALAVPTPITGVSAALKAPEKEAAPAAVENVAAKVKPKKKADEPKEKPKQPKSPKSAKDAKEPKKSKKPKKDA